MTIEELEAGLRLLDRGDIDQVAFWRKNISAFRQTVLQAIRETSEALLALQMPRGCRAELECQVEALQSYLELADRQAAGRVSNSEYGDSQRHRLN